MAKRNQIDAAREAFERFHSREAGEPVYPFDGEDAGEFEHGVKIAPAWCIVGRALRVLYRSDKWHRPGKTTDYYHDHGQGPTTRELVSEVRFWLPAGDKLAKGFEEAELPYEWPEAVTILGQCIGWVFREHDAEGDEVVEGEPDRSLLVASPDGYVSEKDPERCFLAVVGARSGKLEAFIEGPELRNTAEGIDG